MTISSETIKVKQEILTNLITLKKEKGLTNVDGFKEKVMWALNNLNPHFHFICGNAKLPKSTMIINLGTWFNCPGRKERFCELCTECYDKSPEVRFKERIKGRLEQEIIFRALNALELTYIIEQEIRKWNESHEIKIKNIRWSEVGDLRNQNDLDKVINISNQIYEDLDIKSYIYTHNKSLDFWSKKRPGLVINGSGFMVDNEYRVLPKEQIENEFKNLNDLSNKRECICDCTQCNRCLEKNGFILIEEIR